MEEGPVSEGKEMADSRVALEDEGNGCCAVEDNENPMVLDDHGKENEHLNLEFSQHLVGGVAEPTLDMEFTSEDDARNFYNAYAKQTGFSIRVNSYYRSKKDNSIISREFCCSKEGFRRGKHSKKLDSGDDTKRRRARPITREGCKALMTVRRRDNGKWYVAKLEKNHSHELVTPAMRHFLRSHKEVDDPKKSLNGSLGCVGVGLNASVNALPGEYNSFGKLGFATQNNVNHVGKGRLSYFGSSHRYCKRHILSKMPKEIGHAFSSLPKTFQVEFDKCINRSETPEEFESAWQLLLDKYSLRVNEWLQSLYIDRKLWVSTYVRDIFFAGMYSTQQNRSVSSLFDGYVNAGTTLQDFAEPYERALDCRYEKEVSAEFETFYTKPVLRTPLPMEKQAAEVYTRKMFLVFQNEIYESLVLAVTSSQDDGLAKIYEVARFDEEHKVYRVGLNIADQIASCSCKMFEFEGILCRHVIAVFKATNIFLLPQHYILKRWTKNAKEDAKFDALPPVSIHGDSRMGKKQYNLLYQEAVKCAEEGMASDHSFEVALNALREARIKIVSAKKNAITVQKLDAAPSTN
ncbi:hypothetical protein V6N12_022288 [Hibiscus sabdariffa]|uniref:Protein FAR1-RELATED SEQUENCE n=1 Tax=Hibiscus sabdariffa TaxID=183260 RepID=A0ABR2FUI6_9ROSI